MTSFRNVKHRKNRELLVNPKLTLKSRVLATVFGSVLAWCFALAAHAADPVWVDVRTPGEFDAGHLSIAVNIPHGSIVEGLASVTDDKSAPVFLYCRSGNRAGIAKRALEEAGYTQVVNHGSLEEARAAYAEYNAL